MTTREQTAQKLGSFVVIHFGGGEKELPNGRTQVGGSKAKNSLGALLDYESFYEIVDWITSERQQAVEEFADEVLLKNQRAYSQGWDIECVDTDDIKRALERRGIKTDLPLNRIDQAKEEYKEKL